MVCLPFFLGGGLRKQTIKATMYPSLGPQTMELLGVIEP